MKKHWEVKRLGDVCEVLDSKRKPITKRDRIAGKYPYYGATGILDYVHDYIFNEKLILIGEDGAKWGAGENTAFIAEGKYWVNNHAHVIRPDRSIVLDNWIVYFLNFSDLQKYVTGLTVPKLNQEKMRGITLPLPSLPEQKRIVDVLDEAFVALEKAKANAEKNLQNARELFESYLQGIFANPGDGWEEMRLADVCTLKSGTTVSAALEKTAGDLPYLKVADMTHAGNEVEIVSSSRFLNKADIGRNAVLPSGTTIFPKRGGAILTNKKRLTAVPICADLNIMGVIPGKSLLPKYLYFYFLNIDMRQIGSGSSIPQINNYDIEPLVISFPKSAGQQAEIVSKLDELSTETQRLESIYRKKLADLEELKKSVLQKAFNGELPEAKI